MSVAALPEAPRPPDLPAVVEHLHHLGLVHAADQVPAMITRAMKKQSGPCAFLEEVLRIEIESREERRVKTAIKLAAMPTGATLSNFRAPDLADCSLIPWRIPDAVRFLGRWC